ncbi:hypothetical protein J5N97_011199 [Dioscorea zingiberensis]|uniref:TF-B3 domain-containing protein n=1 Tax=Dioscorea zingiberensis TaxID=325984 RepID=A0A9D5D1R8_9LILI|nr:hypothetical protein J5N97_011199 [Dioscorea zingiberensis]
MPAPRALSACLEDLHHQERLRIQLAQMERERIASIHRRNRARRSLVRNIRLQRTNSNGSLTSSATSRRRSVPSCHNSNLRLVIQKELKNSDVSIHGRIVIPKRAAEAALPYLYDKDGIDLCVKDVFTGKRWIMRYRFWPNHASRMYLLDNTGGYIKKNNLASGDLVALFKDVNQRYYIGCKKMARLLPPCRPLRMGKAKNEVQNIQRELEHLFDSDDGEELPSAASPIKKEFEEMLRGINGDKGKSVAIAQTDVAGTSKGNADMSLEAGPVQNGPLCIDEPGTGNGNADMSLEAGPVQNGPLCIDEPVINLDDFSAELFGEIHLSGNLLDEFLWE